MRSFVKMTNVTMVGNGVGISVPEGAPIDMDLNSTLFAGNDKAIEVRSGENMIRVEFPPEIRDLLRSSLREREAQGATRQEAIEQVAQAHGPRLISLLRDKGIDIAALGTSVASLIAQLFAS